MSKLSKFEKLKKRVETLQNELSEAKGKLASTKQTAREEFGTDDSDKLKALLNKNIVKIKKLESSIESLSNELEEKLEEIEKEREANVV